MDTKGEAEIVTKDRCGVLKRLAHFFIEIQKTTF